MNPSDTAANPSAAFTTAVASLVSSDDAIGVITRLLLDATQAVAADGAGLVIASARGDLELLTAVSHRAEELELFQLQADAGPCVDAVRLGEPVVSPTYAATSERWPALAVAIRSAGFAALHATPMRWQGQTFGALNLFWNTDRDTAHLRPLIQGYSDIATIAIVHAGHITTTQLGERTGAALASRHIIEQAKGVIAYRERLSMSGAYDRLLNLAAADSVNLSVMATSIVEQARRGSAGG